ncbi:hypothetical protein OG394_05425 [Kribbella sp. NBC_01245]|uniref:hypothetical protein n=1 Tax=Kribbella sp. NBC_01245 TaxID=2903578 RepID=UPI002E2C71DB|nr:hypothetical protein [Kribbella sp. NBC_01245]
MREQVESWPTPTAQLVPTREAIGTAVWAYQVRDESFEQQGHRMIAEALGRG